MMISDNTSYKIVRNVFLLSVLCGFILILIGWLLVPTTNFLSITSTSFILAIYGIVGYFGFHRIRLEIFQIIGLFGLLSGTIFVAEILLEYAILPANNTSWGLIEFGSVFVLYFLCGWLVVYRYKTIKDGTLATIVSAMLSSVIWFVIILLVFYIFRGTVRQEAVFQAEGNLEDFARSGMNDINAFMMEDFLGAGFFHLLLSPIFAAVLGTIGSLLGKGIAQFRKP